MGQKALYHEIVLIRQSELLKKEKQADSEGAEREIEEYSYDPNGNMLSKLSSVESPTSQTESASLEELGSEGATGAALYEYDVWNNLVKTVDGQNIVEMTYNGDGQRVSKSSGGSVTRHMYESDRVILEVDGNGNQTAYNMYGTDLLKRNVDGESLLYLYNGHSDVTALMTSNGSVAASYYYDAFGNITETTGQANNPFRYAGYQYDEESKLYYLNSRHYAPDIARFMQEDTYLGDQADPLSLNLYTYCMNNPIKYYDSSGYSVELVGYGAAAGVVPITNYQLMKQERYVAGIELMNLIHKAAVEAAAAQMRTEMLKNASLTVGVSNISVQYVVGSNIRKSSNVVTTSTSRTKKSRKIISLSYAQIETLEQEMRGEDEYGNVIEVLSEEEKEDIRREFYKSLGASGATDVVIIGNEGEYTGTANEIREQKAKQQADILNYILKYTNMNAYISSQAIHGGNTNNITADQITSYLASVYNKVNDKSRISGVYMNQEALYSVSDYNNFDNQYDFKRMKAVSDFVHNSKTIGGRKSFLWIPYWAAERFHKDGTPYTEADLIRLCNNKTPANMIKDIAYVVNRGIFDEVMIQPRMYDAYWDKERTKVQSRGAAGNYYGVLRSIQYQDIRYNDGTRVRVRNSNGSLGWGSNPNTKIGFMMENGSHIVNGGDFNVYAQLAAEVSRSNLIGVPMGYYWDMGGRVYNAGTWVGPGTMVRHEQEIGNYGNMMSYIYESFFKGADANVK